MSTRIACASACVVLARRESLLELLVDPGTGGPLKCEAPAFNSEGELVSGTLIGPTGVAYHISNGIPRFRSVGETDQDQTADSFGFKWHRRDRYDSPAIHTFMTDWLALKYGFGSIEVMRKYFSGRSRILDAGCGSGLSASVWLDPSWREGAWIGADISSAIDVARDRLGHIHDTHFVQADLMQLPFAGESFDTIFSEGVLHHTPSTELALKSLIPFLVQGGEILFYVYRKKAPIREFTDDYVRDAVAPLDPETAWEQLRPVTKLGEALAGLKAEIEVSEDIPLLGIKAGRYDVQRLVYWHVAKLFWNPTLTFEENHLINFDWYHPRYAHRQTEDDVRRWCHEASLSIVHFDVQESGFTVRAKKD
jgi:arsenite methyltransferase